MWDEKRRFVAATWAGDVRTKCKGSDVFGACTSDGFKGACVRAESSEMSGSLSTAGPMPHPQVAPAALKNTSRRGKEGQLLK